VAALLAGCGSTVQASSTSTQGGQGSDGLGPAGNAGTKTTAAASAGPDSAPASTDASSGGGTQTEGPQSQALDPTGTGGAPVAAAAGPSSGPGFTRTTVRIGIATADDYNSFAKSTGLKGLAVQGDPNVWFTAVVDDINKHGGLLGRRIELVKHDYNTAQTLSNPAAANQEACTTWTQDNHVFAVVGPPIVEDTLLTCLKKANTPLIQIGAGLDYPLHYSETYAKNPLYFNLAQMDGDRFDQIAVSRLVVRHYFDPWDTRTGQRGTPTANPTKVGIISFDDHDGSLQLASLEKQLRAHGLRSANTVACPRSLSDKISCEQSAVLKFRSNGITHVINADSTFMNNASSQGYYPRYFLPIEPAAFAANVPAKELAGSMSEGYIPFVDVPADQYPGDPTPATAACKRLMKAAGQATTDSTTLLAQMSVCDGFTFLRDAAAAAGALGASALKSGFESLGSRSLSALTYKTFLSPQVHASAVALRDLVFRSDLKNFVYVSRTDYEAAS
jgi:hypothetical protein